MIRSRSRRVIPAVLALSLALGAAVPSLAARSPSGSVQVVPQRVTIGARAMLVGSRLPANKYFFLILAIPNANSARLKQFIPTTAKSDGHGALRVQFRMPIVPLCGPASIYVSQAGSSASLRAAITIAGCKATGRVSTPPPPPTRKLPARKKGKK